MFDFNTAALTDAESSVMILEVLAKPGAAMYPESAASLNLLVRTSSKRPLAVGRGLIAYLADPRCVIAPKPGTRVSTLMNNAASPYRNLLRKSFTLYLNGLRAEMKRRRMPHEIKMSNATTLYQELLDFTRAHKDSPFSKYVPWQKIQAFAGPRMVQGFYRDLVRHAALRSRVTEGKNISRDDLNDKKILKEMAEDMVAALRQSMPQQHKDLTLRLPALKSLMR